jgi:hypothetical protein
VGGVSTPGPANGPDLLFPIGLLTGTFPDEAGEHHHEIRRGGKIHELTDAELAAWAFSHGPPEAIANVDPHWTKDAVEERLRGTGIAETAAIVDGLLGRGLLVEAPVAGDRAVAFARAHRAVPIMYGLGNSPEEPSRYSIGPLGHEVAQVSWPVYELWAWAHLDGDLWRGCEAFAEQERAAGGTDPIVSDAAQVLAGFLGMLHGLLNAQAVYLDPVGGAS